MPPPRSHPTHPLTLLCLPIGHVDCGAVKASVDQRDIGLVGNWIRNIRDVYRLHVHELDAVTDPKARHRRLVELNVVEQCLNLYKNGTVQRKRQQTFRESGSAYPRIHGLVFDPSDGVLHRLPVNFGEKFKPFRHVCVGGACSKRRRVVPCGDDAC